MAGILKYPDKKMCEQLINGYRKEDLSATINYGPFIMKCGEVKTFYYLPELFNGLAKTHDGYRWSRNKKNEKRIQPVKRSFNIAGSTIEMLNCQCPTIDTFKKSVIIAPHIIVVRYFCEADINIQPGEVRCEGRFAELARSALEGSSTKTAFVHLNKSGVPLKKTQIINQLKNISCRSGLFKTGPKPITSMSDLSTLQNLSPLSQFSQWGAGKYTAFRFINVFEQSLAIFVRQLPSKEEYSRLQTVIDESLARGSKVVEICKDLSLQARSGYILPARLFADTTFCITDAYVTVVLGQLSHFWTAKSAKPRTIIIGYMLHNTKTREQHTAFAEYFAEQVKKVIPKDRIIPAIVVDGEPALQAYGEKLGTPILRCSIHRMANMELAIGKEKIEEAKRCLYGSFENGEYKAGVLCSRTIEDMRRRVDRMEESKLKDWIKKNDEELFIHESLLAKLRSGWVVPLATTNAIENMNNKIKQVCTKPMKGNDLGKWLVKFVGDEIDSLSRSIQGIDVNVLYDDSDKYKALSYDEQLQFVENLGISMSTLKMWPFGDVLRMSLKKPTLDKNLRAATTIKCTTYGDGYIAESPTGRLIKIERCLKTSCLLCAACSIQLPYEICEHVLSALIKLDYGSLENELSFLDKRAALTTSRKMHLLKADSKSGKKGGRKGKTWSKGNYIRKFEDIDEISLFSNETQDDGLGSDVTIDNSVIVSVNDKTSQDNDIGSTRMTLFSNQNRDCRLESEGRSDSVVLDEEANQESVGFENLNWSLRENDVTGSTSDKSIHHSSALHPDVMGFSSYLSDALVGEEIEQSRFGRTRKRKLTFSPR